MRKHRFVRGSMIPAAGQLVFYVALALFFFYATLRLPGYDPFIPDSVTERVVPQGLLSRVLRAAVTDYQRVPIPGEAEIELGGKYVYDSAFIEIDRNASELAWMGDDVTSCLYELHQGDRRVQGQLCIPPGMSTRYWMPGRVGIPHSGLFVEPGIYRVLIADEVSFPPSANAELVLGPKLTSVVDYYVRRAMVALPLVFVGVMLARRGFRWLRTGDRRRDQEARAAHQRELWDQRTCKR